MVEEILEERMELLNLVEAEEELEELGQLVQRLMLEEMVVQD